MMSADEGTQNPARELPERGNTADRAVAARYDDVASADWLRQLEADLRVDAERRGEPLRPRGWLARVLAR